MSARRFPSLPAFSLRLARQRDFETLYAIDQVCYSPAIAYSRDELHWYMDLRGAECMVAEVPTRAKASTRIAGFIVTVSRDTHGHIITIDVLEKFRHAGIGSALLRRAEAQMRRLGVSKAWLETAINNEVAIAFWKKHGYRSHGRLPNYYPDGLDALAMSKQLSDPTAARN